MFINTIISRFFGRRYYKYKDPIEEPTRQRRRLFREMIRDRANQKHVRYRLASQILRLTWMVLASFVGIWFERDRAQYIANQRHGKVMWSPLIMTLGTCWVVASWLVLCSVLFQIRLQMPLYRRYQHNSVETIGKVIECERAVVKTTFKVVVVYRATPADHEAFYYAKVFFLKDLVEHSREEFPLLLLPGVPTSAASKSQIKSLKYYQCPKPWIILIAASSIGFAWHWIMTGPWEQHHRLLWFWMGNTTVGLLLGYWKVLDQNRILLDGGACGVPVELIPWLSLEMQDVEGTEEEKTERIMEDCTDSMPPPGTERLIPLASDDYMITSRTMETDEQEQAVKKSTIVEAQNDFSHHGTRNNSKDWSWYHSRKEAWMKNQMTNLENETDISQEEGRNDEQDLMLNNTSNAEGRWLDEDDVVTSDGKATPEEKHPSFDNLSEYLLHSWPEKRTMKGDNITLQQQQQQQQQHILLSDSPTTL